MDIHFFLIWVKLPYSNILKTASVEWLNGTTRTDLAILTFVRSTTAKVRKNKFFTLLQWSQGVYMENRDIIFEKIHAKEKEWKAQVEYLQSKIVNYDLDRRIKIENLIDMLNLKLKEIENRTHELKQISSNLHQDVGEKLIYSWVELFTEIDNAMINLKNKLG